MLIDYIKKDNSLVFIDEYCDENISGTGTYRPEFERLLNDCKSGKINTILCKSQSRFSRDIEIVEKYINNKFKEWNIRFISITDNIDTMKNESAKTRQINALINEWYLEDISNNIRSALKIKMKQGELISPFAPYGYKKDINNKNKLLIDTDASKIVKLIFNLYLKGYNYTSIAALLNKNKIPPPSLYKKMHNINLNIVSNKNIENINWNINTIKSILTNEIYIGNLVQGKRTTISYKNHKIIKKDKSTWIKKDKTHKKIIDETTFIKVKRKIEKNQNNHTKGSNIFSGKFYCSECKGIMRKKISQKHKYLVCSNSEKGICDNKKSIRFDSLEKIILNSINNNIELLVDKKILTKLNNKEKNNLNILIKIQKLDKEIINLFISKIEINKDKQNKRIITITWNF